MNAEDAICDFLLNSEEHCPTTAIAVAELGSRLGDPAKAEKIMAAWYAVLPTDPLWMQLRKPEPFDRTLRNWIRSV